MDMRGLPASGPLAGHGGASPVFTLNLLGKVLSSRPKSTARGVPPGSAVIATVDWGGLNPRQKIQIYLYPCPNLIPYDFRDMT